jgi:hypothetical protein
VTQKPRLLILSFSPIVGDARVLKQVKHFQDEYEVTTCGYGDAPDGVAGHIRIPDDKPQNNLYPRYLVLRLFERVYWRTGAANWGRANLPKGEWDMILANDVETVPLALSLRPPLGVHADIHEYSPLLHSENRAWMRWIAPYFRWLCRKYVRRASSWTTVSGGLARRYQSDFGFEPLVASNAAPEWPGHPTETASPLRLVHSGAGLTNRELEIMIDAVKLAKNDYTLDLYLTANHPAYILELRRRADDVDGVTVHDPVPYTELPAILNTFDVGVFVLPPVNFSYEWALPNKLFDFIQARLAIVVGPSPEMASIVSENKLGLVTRDFSAQSLADALDSLTVESVDEFKASAHRAASLLTSESGIQVWDEAIAALAAGRVAVP